MKIDLQTPENEPAASKDGKPDGDFSVEGDSGALTTGGQAHLPPPPPGRR